MPQDSNVTFAKTVAWIFVILFFGYLVYTYLQEHKDAAAAGTAGPTPSSGATPKVFRTPWGRAGASPTPAPQTPPGPDGGEGTTTKALTVKEAMALTGKVTPGAGLRLRGNFVVTASGASRVVMRVANAAEPGAGAARVLVVYPNGVAPPADGTRISFTGDEALQIDDVRRDANGMFNIYTRKARPPGQ